MRLVFAGTPDPAVPSLQRLLASPRHDVVAVVTRPDARAGRGRQPAQSPVKQLAEQAGVPVLQPARPSEPEFLDALRAMAPDCCPVVAYGALVPPAALAVPRLGWVNLHYSLLPAWRGAAPVQHALLAGDEITGATTFLLEQGLDTGPVFGVVTEQVRSTDTAGDLLDRLSRSGADLLVATLDALEGGELVAQPQPADGVSLAPKLTSEDARVRWDEPAMAVDRRIRACTPAPGAWTTFRGARVKLAPVVPQPGNVPGAPGSLEVTRGSVLVAAAGGFVELGVVQPAGKGPMPAADWARGVRPQPGELLV